MKIKEAAFLSLASRCGFGRFEPHANAPSAYNFYTGEYRCILFLDIHNGHVRSGQLFVGFDLSVNEHQVNVWNRNNRFVKAYQSPQGLLAVELDLLSGVANEDGLREVFTLWSIQLSRLGEVFG
ncbi:MAG TPA: YbjN domain-containing protein [Asticcacaulis sp.]|jgi:hypothetical protein|nr:YbjN domain-containing protein [Asticcacaulis sp.]